MELRRYLLIGAVAAAALGASGQIKRYPLDDRASYAVRISTEVPTTVLFPEKITALDGANLSAKPEEAPVQLSHQPGTGYFSVRALRPDAKAAVNVLLRDQVFALEFQTGVGPDRTVTFYDTPATGTGLVSGTISRAALCLSLLDRAKNYAALTAQHPVLAQQVERAAPVATTVADGLEVTIHDVFRFAADDCLVFRVRLANTSGARLRFDPAQLSVRTGARLYPAAITDASGDIPTGTAEDVWLAVIGEPDGRLANLSLGNRFTVIVTRLP